MKSLHLELTDIRKAEVLEKGCNFEGQYIIMSGGTPTAGGGLMRQRFNQGYASSGDDLEDDACSKTPVEFSMPSVRRARTWGEVLENFVWFASAVFIIYYGDWESNLVSVLWSDGRIRRSALRLGLVSSVLNIFMFIYTTHYASSFPPKSYEKSEAFVSAAPTLMALGLFSFCLFSYALWPIWSFLTIPLLFTLFMATLVISPYLPVGPLRPQSFVLRTD